MPKNVMKQSILLLLPTIALLASCRTPMSSTGIQHAQYENDSLLEQATLESSKVQRFERDTTYVLDSVHVETRNDTVYHNHWRTEYRDRLIEKTDTIEQYHAITEFVRNTEEEKETKEIEITKVPRWCWRLLVWNIIILLLIVIRFCYRSYKKLYK